MANFNKTELKAKWNLLVARKARRIAWITMLMAEYLQLRQTDNDNSGNYKRPEIIVAGIPIWGLGRIGHALSDEILKYRSTGGFFMAHQKGSKETFKFTAK